VFIYKVFNSGETVLQEHDDVQNKQRMWWRKVEIFSRTRNLIEPKMFA
jgi:hypothetical protein